MKLYKRKVSSEDTVSIVNSVFASTVVYIVSTVSTEIIAIRVN